MCDFLGILLLVVLCAGLGAYLTYCYFTNGFSEQDKALRSRELAVQQKSQENEARARQLEEWAAAEAERQRRQLAAVNAAQAMLNRGEPADTSYAGVSQYQRQAFRQGALVGEYVRVIYLLSTDGFLTLRWELDWPATNDPMLQITRDSYVIRTDCGRLGEHKEHVRPGRYTYKFSVHDPQARNRQLGQTLVAEIVVPVPEVWNSSPPGVAVAVAAAPKKQRPGQRTQALLVEKVGEFVAAERAAAKLRQAVEKALRKQELPDEELESRMSRLDGRIAEIRDEIGT